MATHEPPAVRRAQILEAALHCFGEKGLHASKMDDIVQASGLSKGAIYWHFKGKEELFLALFDAVEAELFASWEALEGDDALESLRRMAEFSLARVLETRPLLEAWTEFLRHPKSRERMAEVYRRSRERIAAVVTKGIADGQLSPADPDHVAATLTAQVEGLLLQSFADPTFSPKTTWPTTWQITAKGLQASGEPSEPASTPSGGSGWGGA